MKNQQYKISALERDERAISMPARVPLGRAMKALREAILEAFRTGSTWEIVQVCNDQLKPLLDAQTELAYLKGGRRIQLTSEKILSESKKEYAPVRFSLSDDDETATRGVADYLRKISGIDPSNFSDSFEKHNAGAIGNLASAICDEVKKAQIDLTQAGIHVKGGKAEIARILAQNGVQAPNLGALAETLFRTHTQQAYSAGRWNTATDPDFADEIWGFEYVTAHDPRVREGHRVLDGVRLPKEDPFWAKYFPPNGWNCRCTTLDIWYDDAEAKINFGITGRDPRKRTPEEMDVSKEFQGNVGIFATLEPVKTPKPSPISIPKTIPTQPKTALKTHKNGGSSPVYYEEISPIPSDEKIPPETWLEDIDKKVWKVLENEEILKFNSEKKSKFREKAEKAISKVSKQAGKRIKVDFGSWGDEKHALDCRLVNTYTAGIVAVIQKFPILAHCVKEISSDILTRAKGSYNPITQDLHFASNVKYSTIEADIVHEKQSGEKSTAHINHTAYHELGHALFCKICSHNEIPECLDFVKFATKTHGTILAMTNEEIVKQSSFYATKSADEMFAECFAEYFGSREPRLIAKHVVEGAFTVQKALEMKMKGN
ncbi:MAG: phage minor head protein [Planctomycetia bacterium]|nr:phage minor head protein [Planctomycetia bacterium]